MRNVHLYIDGVVQGVGYREFVKRHAQELKLRGYVRNNEGGVEVQAEGENEAVVKLIELCWKGPTAAKISNVTVEEHAPNYLFEEFEIKP